jgi:hypothetical protein
VASSMQSVAIPKELTRRLYTYLTNVTGKATLSLCLIKHYTNEDIEGRGGEERRGTVPHNLTLALDGNECSTSCPGRFNLGERAPGT